MTVIVNTYRIFWERWPSSDPSFARAHGAPKYSAQGPANC